MERRRRGVHQTPLARLMVTIIFIIIIDIIEKNPLGADGAPYRASAAPCRLPIKQDGGHGGQSLDAAGVGLARGHGEGREPGPGGERSRPENFQ